MERMFYGNASAARRVPKMNCSPAQRICEHELVAKVMVESLGPWVDTMDVPSEPKVRSLDHLYHLERQLQGRVRSSTGFKSGRCLAPPPALVFICSHQR